MAHDLNPSQYDAVNTLSGPLLVLAGAGTGKTRVITYRIARLIASGTRANRILAVTFTNKAAREMQERAKELLASRGLLRGGKDALKPEISTFHSLCVKILRRHLTKLGYPSAWTIYDRGDQEGVARAVLRELRVETATLRPGDLLSRISGWKSRGVNPEMAESMASSDQEHLAAMGFRRYQKSLKASGAVDFDDLLLCTGDLFQQFPEIREQESCRFDHLLIDEYQDTNGLQYKIVKAMAAPHRNLCVVGDDDQSIYGWRGAEVTHILHFQRDWPEAKVVRLEDNYRSTGPILALANRLIGYNAHRHEKTLRATTADGPQPRFVKYSDEAEEAGGIVREIARLVADKIVKLRDIAILFRTNEQPRAFEDELRRERIPYLLVGGMSFYDRREVRDVLAFLRVLVQPADESALLRIINTPPRGIGQSTVEALIREAVQRGVSVWHVLSDARSIPGVSLAAAEAIGKFTHLVNEFHARTRSQSAVSVAGGLLEAVRYKSEISRQYPDPLEQESRWKVVEEVINAIGAYEQRTTAPSLSGYLDEVALAERDQQRADPREQDRDALRLMTLHSAKGLEFPHVYLVGLEEGLLPHHRAVAEDGSAIDEERRLAYVGVTRARSCLTLSFAETRLKWGKPRKSIPSRFLFEMRDLDQNPDLRDVLDRVVRASRSAAMGINTPSQFRGRASSTGGSGGASRPAGNGPVRPPSTSRPAPSRPSASGGSPGTPSKPAPQPPSNAPVAHLPGPWAKKKPPAE